MARDKFAWLNAEHPIFKAWMRPVPLAGAANSDPAGERAMYEAGTSAASMGAWRRNERRRRGGDDVLAELRPFQWEPAGGDDHTARAAQATYTNFPERLATAMVGHLFRSAPRPGKGLNFGALGTVDEDKYNPRNPSKAEMLWYNVDGAGNNGSTWKTWWAAREDEAMTFGHVWIMAESRGRPANLADELAGKRPYLVSWKPYDVSNWRFGEDGKLLWAIIRPTVRRPRVVNGELVGNDPVREYLVMVAAGCTDLGPEYERGGWWRFTHDRKPLLGAGGVHESGTWESTGGQVPLWPLVYQEDNGSPDLPAMSRPAITELGQLAVSHMNLESARDYDMWDMAASLVFLLNVDLAGHKLAVQQLKAGNRIIPVPAAKGDNVPPVQVHEGSQGVSASQVFTEALKDKRASAAEMMASEATSVPEASGVSKQAGFNELKAPRLVLMGNHLAAAQNNALYFLALRWGVTPDGFTEWPSDYDILPLVDDIREMFDLEALAQVKSPTLAASLLRLALKEKNLTPKPEDLEVIEGEWIADAERQMREAELAAQGGGEFGAAA